jgi:hypothetical protein
VSALAGTALAFALALTAEAFLLRGRRAQTCLGALLAIHVACATVWCLVAGRTLEVSALPIVLFWAGALLLWLGVRLHIESSILLRLVGLLREGPLPGAELLARCESQYGVAARLEELERGGFVRRDGERVALRTRGRVVTALAGLATAARRH